MKKIEQLSGCPVHHDGTSAHSTYCAEFISGIRGDINNVPYETMSSWATDEEIHHLSFIVKTEFAIPYAFDKGGIWPGTQSRY